MTGFFRKFAGAFIEVERDGKEEATAAAETGSGPFDEITRETSQLLAQLEGAQGGSSPLSPSDAPQQVSTADDQTVLEISALQMTADQVFAASGIVDGPSSAQRMLKLIAGLAMFPAEQQVLMVRAMDAADDSWSETEVLEDARHRQSALRRHLQMMEEERNTRLLALNQRIETTRAEGQRILEEIDNQLAQLQKKREGAVVDITNATGQLAQQIKELETSAETARRGITQVINALSQLITFFTGGKGGQPIGRV